MTRKAELTPFEMQKTVQRGLSVDKWGMSVENWEFDSGQVKFEILTNI